MERKKYVIIMAAGSGTRMGAGRPKQFLELEGKAILQKTMEVFLNACPGISVITVLPQDFIGYWREPPTTTPLETILHLFWQK